METLQKLHLEISPWEEWFQEAWIKGKNFSCSTQRTHELICKYIRRLYETMYSRMDRVKFVEDSLQQIWSDMVCLGRSA